MEKPTKWKRRTKKKNTQMFLKHQIICHICRSTYYAKLSAACHLLQHWPSSWIFLDGLGHAQRVRRTYQAPLQIGPRRVPLLKMFDSAADEGLTNCECSRVFSSSLGTQRVCSYDVSCHTKSTFRFYMFLCLSPLWASKLGQVNLTPKGRFFYSEHGGQVSARPWGQRALLCPPAVQYTGDQHQA